ncbi:carboxymuconolactone decarboxylase family protein [Shewanella sp. HN-41]|uniref:carboxymuconolactone decarboxylase family protein n=1 Tax=Shewanella sp. HN-41 TaxID=327275 RepID=UPI000562791B|nr:carboxymuconolactone decarboxylase family protein [Shewanella sp. HN-41]
MSSYMLHTLETAPAASLPFLEKSLKGFGSIPNLHAVMAESPKVLEAYQTLHELFNQSSLNAIEKTIVWQTINIEHQCHYCVPAHTAIAHMMKIDSTIIDALTHKRPLPTHEQQVLRETTLALVRNRGQLSHEQKQAFFDAGYTKQQLLEIVLGISQKVMSNYINHIVDTPLDDAFKAFR